MDICLPPSHTLYTWFMNDPKANLSYVIYVWPLRLRDPHGNSSEWKGKWSDIDQENWKKISNRRKKNLNIKFKDDGEFYMEIKDFFTYFDHMEFCHLSQDSNKKIEKFHFHGKWNMEYKQSNGLRIGDSSKFYINMYNYLFILDF